MENYLKRDVVHGFYQGVLYLQNIAFLRFACKLNLIYARRNVRPSWCQFPLNSKKTQHNYVQICESTDKNHLHPLPKYDSVNRHTIIFEKLCRKKKWCPKCNPKVCKIIIIITITTTTTKHGQNLFCALRYNVISFIEPISRKPQSRNYTWLKPPYPEFHKNRPANIKNRADIYLCT